MSIQNIIRKIPNYAIDLKANFSELFSQEIEGLSKSQLLGVALAVAYTLKHEQLLNAIRNEAKVVLDDSHFDAAKSAVAIMGLNNTYYGFLEMISDEEISNMPIGLHMSVLRDPGIDKLDYEMYLLSVSIINNCKYCTIFHKNILIKKGVQKPAIRSIARIAAVLKGVAAVLETEGLRTYEFVLRGENF